MHALYSRTAFTLIELILAVAIIAVIAAQIVAAINPRQRLQDARDVRSAVSMNDVRKAVIAYLSDGGSSTLNVTDPGSSLEVCPYLSAPIGCISLDFLVEQGYLLSLPVLDGAPSGTTGYKVVFKSNYYDGITASVIAGSSSSSSTTAASSIGETSSSVSSPPPPFVDSFVAIVLTGSAVMTIENQHYIQRNNILLSGNARLIIQNSIFEHRTAYAGQYELSAKDNAKVVIIDSEVRSSPWVNWRLRNNAELTLDNVAQTASSIWHVFFDNTKLHAIGSKFYGTIVHNAQFDIADSPQTYIELAFPVGAIVDEALPALMADYTFPNANDQNIPFSLHIAGSTAVAWGITQLPSSTVILRDTTVAPVTITMSSRLPWVGTTSTMDNLQPTLYADASWSLIGNPLTPTDDMNLRLINVRTTKWSPYAGDNTTLILTNSTLADNSAGWGKSKTFITNSSTTFIRARDTMEMTLTDTSTSSDVTAYDSSIVTVQNSSVRKIIDGSVVANQAARIDIDNAHIKKAVTANGTSTINIVDSAIDGVITARNGGIITLTNCSFNPGLIVEEQSGQVVISP